MSSIIKDKGDIEKYQWLIETVKGMDFSEETVDFALHYLLENTENKPDVLVDTGYFASFSPRLEAICYNPCLLDRALDLLIRNLRSDCKDYLLLRSVLLTYVLEHEIEHYYQYLISERIESCESINMERAYKLIYGLVKDRTFRERLYSRNHIDSLKAYNAGKENYFIERNSQIEAYDTIIRVLEDLYPDLANEFRVIRNQYLVWGYENNNNEGNVYTTMKEIGLLPKYERRYREEDLSFEDRIRFGLPISGHEQGKVMSLK